MFCFLDEMFIRQEKIGQFEEWKSDIEKYFSVNIVESQIDEGTGGLVIRYRDGSSIRYNGSLSMGKNRDFFGTRLYKVQCIAMVDFEKITYNQGSAFGPGARLF